MDVSSDCSKDSVPMQVRNYEFSKDDIIVPIYQGNRRILLSDSEDDIVSSDYDTNENIIVNGVDNRSENDMELIYKLEAYDRTPSVNTISHDQKNVLE